MRNWITTVLTGLAALLFADVAPASAQPRMPRTFINASFGIQATSRTEEAALSFPLYDELAIFAQDVEVGGGPFFDANFGFRVMTDYNIYVSAGLSYFGTNTDAAGIASIPNPSFFNQPALIPIAEEDLARKELGFHFSAVYLQPVTDKIDVAISAGPSIFHISQEFISGTVAAGTQNMTPMIEDQSGTGVGLNIGGDVTYRVTPQMGIGVLLRYAWAPVDLDGGSMNAGGFQIGAGIRIRMQ